MRLIIVIGVLALAQSVRADMIHHELSTLCYDDRVHLVVQSNTCGQFCDEEGNGSLYGCKDSPDGMEISHVGNVDYWTSWECTCKCTAGPDEGTSFPCNQGSCREPSDFSGKYQECNTSAKGILDTPCSELAGVVKLCTSSTADCDDEDDIDCFDFDDAPPVGEADASYADAGYGNEDDGAGSCECSIGLRRARQSVVSGFTAVFVLAIFMLRRRRQGSR
jgi:hypothetical protein